MWSIIKPYRSIFISTAETIKTNAVTILCRQQPKTQIQTHTDTGRDRADIMQTT